MELSMATAGRADSAPIGSAPALDMSSLLITNSRRGTVYYFSEHGRFNFFSVIIFGIKLPPKFSHHSRKGRVTPETFLFEGTVLRIRRTKRCRGTRHYPNRIQ